MKVETPLSPPSRQSLSTNEKLKDTISEADVISAYQENILVGGTVSEEMAYELKTACGRYSPGWVMDAMKEAIRANEPSWRYIVGILKNWSKEGKGR